MQVKIIGDITMDTKISAVFKNCISPYVYCKNNSIKLNIRDKKNDKFSGIRDCNDNLLSSEEKLWVNHDDIGVANGCKL